MIYYLISFFHSNNIGDLLLSKEMYTHLHNGCEIIPMDFCDSEIVKTELFSDTPPVEIRDSFSLSQQSFLKRLLIPAAAFLANFHLDKWKHYTELVKKADGIIIGGGNMVMDRGKFPNYTLSFYRYIKIAKENGKKVYVMDVGAGPFRTIIQRKLAIKAVLAADYVSTRDAASQTLLKTAQLSRDPAFFFSANEMCEQKSLICISVICNGNFFAGEYPSYLKGLKKIVNCLKEYGKIVLYSTEGNDYPAVNAFYRILCDRDVQIENVRTANEVKKLYSRAKIVIGSRMHSLIIAMTQNVPTIALSWDNKINGLYKLADMEDRVFSVSTVNREADKISILAKQLINLNSDTRTIEFVSKSRSILQNEYSSILNRAKVK